MRNFDHNFVFFGLAMCIGGESGILEHTGSIELDTAWTLSGIALGLMAFSLLAFFCDFAEFAGKRGCLSVDARK